MKAESQTLTVATIWLRLAFVLFSGLVAFGCKPKIGEDCSTSIDCSLSGDRLCDVTQPGGYCTVFNCEPNTCPEEAACVAFSEGTCSAASVSTRFRRTFCMQTCEEDSDCRGGDYRCLDLSRDESRKIVDSNVGDNRICAVPSVTTEQPKRDAPICFPSDASFDVSRPEAGARDARSDAREAGDPDGRDDRSDATGAETAVPDAADDAEDSSGIETGSDAVIDAANEPDPDGDGTSEPVVDAPADDARVD